MNFATDFAALIDDTSFARSAVRIIAIGERRVLDERFAKSLLQKKNRIRSLCAEVEGRNATENLNIYGWP